MNRYNSKESIKMANKDNKKCSKSLNDSVMQIKPTMRCYSMPSRMAIIKKAENNKYQQRCREIGTLTDCWWKCKTV